MNEKWIYFDNPKYKKYRLISAINRHPQNAISMVKVLLYIW